jgi:multidrug efflux pump
LDLNYDAVRALSEIGAKVDQVRGDLPPEAEIPVLDVVSVDSQFASAYLSFSSEFLQQNEITDYLVRAIQPRLSAVDGVQRAEILGARTFAMRIWLNPERMAAHKIGPAQVRNALAANNYLAAVGQTKGALIQVNLTTNTDLESVEEFKHLVVREQDGVIVRLEDIAEVALGAESYDDQVNFTGATAVFVGVWVLPNSNSLDVIKRVRTELDAIRDELPEQLRAEIAYDATKYIDSAIREVVTTLSETLAIVVVVIFLFLGSFRAVIVPVVAIPISLIGAVFLMEMFGFTINLLTLLAIVLSVGLVVDDAIVMVENIERHLREGMTRIESALKGARELVGPVIAMTITLAAVYTPIAFQGGLTGALFREFALTLAGAVLISGIVAITLSPVMSASFLPDEKNLRGLPARIDRDFGRLKDLYVRVLDKTLNARPAIYLAWVVLSVLAVVLFVQSPRELAPNEDQGIIFGVVNTPANSTLGQLAPSVKAVNEMALSYPETEFTFQITTPGGGFWGMGLKPWDERKRTVFELMPLVGAEVNEIPGIQTFPVLPPALPGGGQFPVEFVVASTAEPTEILQFVKELQQKAATSGLFAFPPLIDVKIDQPESQITFDRDKVAELGLSLQAVGQELGSAVGGNYVNRFSIAGRSYKVIPQLERSARLNADQLQDIYVTNPDGDFIALSTFATVEDRVVPRSLNRFQQLNSVKLSGVAIRPLDEALSFLESEAANLLPRGYSVDYTGESRQLRKEGNKFVPAFALAVVLIFLVLAAQFNSFRDPLVILGGSVPLAMFGASIFTFLKMPDPNMHYWTDGWTTTLNVYSQVGLVTLIGLVSKNGILIVEFANELQREGQAKLEAVRNAAAVRLRPILMTTTATVFGHFPLTLVTGPGAEARNSIGLVLVGGMAIGTIFTLFFVPSIYMLFARDRSASTSAAEPTPASAPAPTPAPAG